MAAVISWRNAAEAAGASLSVSSEAAGLGARSLLTPPIGDVWRSGVGGAAQHVFVLDLGVTSPLRLLAVAAPRSGILPGAGATMRWRAGDAGMVAEAQPLLRLNPIDPGFAVQSGLVISRGHVPTTAKATYFDSAGTLQEVGENTARFAYDATSLARLGWLFDPDRTNTARNPRGEGLVAGTPGTPPTYWEAVGGNGISVQIIAVATETGMRRIGVRFFGTATVATQPLVRFDTATNPDAVAASGEQWTGSVFRKRVSGNNPTGGSHCLTLAEWTSGGAFVTQQSAALAAPGIGALRTQRPVCTATLNGGPTTARVMLQYSFDVSAGQAIDVTYGFALPQAEKGNSASSPILPPAGSPQASRRGIETALLRLPATISAGALFVEQAVAAFPASGGAGIVRISAGTDLVEVVPYQAVPPVGGFTARRLGDVVASLYDTAAMVAGTTYRHVAEWGQNLFRLRRDGGAAAVDASGDAPVVNNLLLSSAEGSTYLRDVRVYAPLSDAQAAALAATGSTLVAPLYDSGVLPLTMRRGVAGVVLPAALSARAVSLVVTGAAGDPYLQLGRFWAGDALVTGRAVSYGWGRGVQDAGSADRAPLSGVSNAQPGATGRTLEFDLPLLTAAEAALLDDAALALGNTRQGFAAPFADLAHGMFGRFTEPPAPTQPRFAWFSARIAFQEDL